jgi:hypothetical protein
MARLPFQALADNLIRHIALKQPLLIYSQAQWKSKAQPRRVGDGLGWEPAASVTDEPDYAAPSRP